MSLAPALGAPINCGTFVGATAPVRVFNKRSVASARFRLRVRPINRVFTPTSAANFTVADRIVTTTTGQTLITDYEVAVEYLLPNFALDGIAITTSDPAKLLAPVNGLAQAVSQGNVILKATAPSGEFAAIAAPVVLKGGSGSDTFLSYVAGSAARNATDAIDTRIANKTAAAKPIFSTQNHSAATYVRNTNCWAADLDLTCISPWNSTGGGTRAGTLISPRHVLFCEHYDFHPAVGATIRFIATNNTVVTRTITALATHPDYSPYYPDITIGVLNSDVPAGITFAKILPQNWQTYLPSVSVIGGVYIRGATIPALVLDQEEKALVSDWSSINRSLPIINSELNVFVIPVAPQRLVFYENIIGGDSGNPAFLIINNELVVLNTWTLGGAGSGTNLVLHKNEINTMMTQLGGGYQLTEVNLAGFPTY